MNYGTSGQVDSSDCGTTSTSLLSGLLVQDSVAWQRFTDLYGPLVYFWCRQRHLQPADAADVTQDVFVAVLTNLVTFDRDRPGGSFRGWLWKITQNKIRDRFRARHEQAEGGTDAQQRLALVPETSEDATEDTPPSGEDGILDRRVLDFVRAGVEGRTWQAFWRVSVDQETVADVARNLGLTEGAVYKAKYRVARQIRKEMSELGE